MKNAGDLIASWLASIQATYSTIRLVLSGNRHGILTCAYLVVMLFACWGLGNRRDEDD